MWAQIVETQSVQKAQLDNICDAKEFNSGEIDKSRVKIGSDGECK